MSKAEQTRQFIIEQSALIFNTKGYGTTSLSDIQEITGLTKGAIYGNFSDKNELAVAAYEYNCAWIAHRLRMATENKKTAREALLAYPDYYREHWQQLFKKGGCPMLNASVEADDHLDFLREPVRKSMKRMIKWLRLIIERGQVNKEFRKNKNPEKYASIILSTMEGNILLAKIMNDPKYLELAAERIKQLIITELEK